MAVTIVATAGGASSNSYVTLSEMTTYMEARLNSGAFDDADPDDQNRALVEATRWLDTLTWRGERTTSTQALQWPRQWALDPDSPIQDYYDEDAVPGRVKDAQRELAFQFLVAGTTDAASLEPTRNVKRKKVDVIETEYFDARDTVTGLARFPSATRYIAPLLVSAGPSIKTVRS